MNEEAKDETKAELKATMIFAIIVFLVGWPLGCWDSESGGSSQGRSLPKNLYLESLGRDPFDNLWHIYRDCGAIEYKDATQYLGYKAGEAKCRLCLARWENS